VSVSILLLTMAGLLTRGLARPQSANPGVETRDDYLLYGAFGNRDTNLAKVLSAQISLLHQMQAQPELSTVASGA
jgi:hypothetical protein